MHINADLVVGLRHRKSWSQEELAIASGLNLRTIQRIEADGTAAWATRQGASWDRVDAGVPVVLVILDADPPRTSGMSRACTAR